MIARTKDTLASFFKNLQSDGHILPGASHLSCQFYFLKNPVCVKEATENGQNGGPRDEDGVKKACGDENNRESISYLAPVHLLAEDFLPDHVHLILEYLDPLGDSNIAANKLAQEKRTLFRCLHATVYTLGKWSLGDVQRNLRGGIFTDKDDELPSEFREVQDALAARRFYREDHQQEQPDFELASSYQVQFERNFAPSEAGSHTVISDREFATFYNVLRFYDEVALVVRKHDASFSKTSNFMVHFIQPPFLSEPETGRCFQYNQERPWSFPIFVETEERNSCRKLTPVNYWMATSLEYDIPFVISEVAPHMQDLSRARMLVEAITLARAGQFLLKSTSTRRFFVVAVLLDRNMVASRYIVMQTDLGDPEDANEDRPVCIHRKRFDLTDQEQELDFLREMYNLTTQITALCSEFDRAKQSSLADIKFDAYKILPLNWQPDQMQESASTPSSHSSAESCHDGFDRDIGVFAAEDIQNILRQIDFQIESKPSVHSNLVVIKEKISEKRGYLKFVKRDEEVEILQYLSRINSPSNHIISGVRSWPVEGGYVVYMPIAGCPIIMLENPGEHLWSMAQQLFEAVAFMHEHNVAHLDLKPQNVLAPPGAGRLTIIGFSRSVRVQGPDVTYGGTVGTEDNLPPEINKGEYKPMLADLWSCGRTLEELCMCCRPSGDRTKLLDIARRLMNTDPEARPKMQAVLEWMACMKRGEEDMEMDSV